eukprot:406271_1
MEEKTENKNNNNNAFAALVGHMNLEEAKSLKVNDQIDHRDKFGRFSFATVLEKQGTNLKIHYDGWGNKWDIWSDFSVEIHRFAIIGSISRRPAHKYKEFKKGGYVRINPTQRHPGWKCGKITEMDQNCGQVHIEYSLGDTRYNTYWAHLDDTLEIDDLSVSGYPVSTNEETNEVSWIFQHYLMDKFRTAKNKEKFVTQKFELLNCSWEIFLYPHGENKDSVDYVGIFVKCATLPDGCCKLAANMQITFVEANHILQLSECYVKGQHCGFVK